ncbi:hypothetical protein ACFWVB_02485 [Streptomyces microflavus]|uniref:hypothetical protein n=1 Tax=Streptomyces microflavus TaxID=1919 RepID=UPI003667CD3D
MSTEPPPAAFAVPRDPRTGQVAALAQGLFTEYVNLAGIAAGCVPEEEREALIAHVQQVGAEFFEGLQRVALQPEAPAQP